MLLKRRNALIQAEYRELVKSKIMLLLQCNNLTSMEMAGVRSALSASKSSIKQVKTSVFRTVVDGEDSYLKEFLKGPVHVVVGEGGPQLASGLEKITASGRVHLLAGRVEGVLWTREGCESVLKELKPLKSTQEELISLLKQPAAMLSSLLTQPPQSMYHLLKSLPTETNVTKE